MARLHDLRHFDNVVALVAHLAVSIGCQLLERGLLLALRADTSDRCMLRPY